MPQRVPEEPQVVIDANTRKRGSELSPHIRAKIEGARAVGASWRAISNTFNVPISTARTTVRLSSVRSGSTTLPRTGRPHILSERDGRKILRLARLNPRWTYGRLISESGVDVSTRTVMRFLKQHGITKKREKKPLLKETRHGEEEAREDGDADARNTSIST
ncbi:hypothetical protein ABEF92_007293 [Exophiala dermatitidis]